MISAPTVFLVFGSVPTQTREWPSFAVKDGSPRQWTHPLANGSFRCGFMGQLISTCLRSGHVRSGLSVRTITSARFTDVW